MKILVTGVYGFIGSNFARMAIELGHQVVGFSRNSNSKNKQRISSIVENPNFTMIQGDMANPNDTSEICEGIDVIVNFAAKSFVDHSIRDPKPFIDSNIVGTFNLLESARRYNPKRYIQVSCYDQISRTLTTKGLKEYNELKKGDLVLSLNPKTGKIEEKEIEKIIIQDYDGDMIYFKSDRVNMMVTPNHRMFLKNKYLNSIFVEEAKKTSTRSIAYFPKSQGWIGTDDEFTYAEGVGKVKTKDLFYLVGIFLGDEFTAYQEKQIINKSGLNRKDFLKENRDSKGKFVSKKNGDIKYATCKSYRIFIDIPENDSCRKRVEETLDDLGIKWSKEKNKSGEHIYITSKSWMDFFDRECGKGFLNKQIPPWMKQYNSNYLQYIYEGMMDSDGHKRISYSTSSEKLRDDFCEICIKIGKHVRITKRETDDFTFIEGRQIQGKISYLVYPTNKNKSIRKENTQTKSYKGKVWCLKVKDNANFVVERNGYYEICGNTDEVYGPIMEGAHTENSPLNPGNPYSASKAAADMLCLSYANTYNIPLIITRTENNYGKFQHPQKAIPVWTRKALANEPIPLYGDGKHIRQWLHVQDHCHAILYLIERGTPGEIYHVAGNEEYENIEIVNKIIKLTNSKSEIEFINDSKIRPGHDRRYAVSSEKLRMLGWDTRHSLKSGLKQTVDWFKLNEWWWFK